MMWTQGTRAHACLVALLMVAVVIALSQPVMSAGAGTVEIMSPGGPVSGEYILNVSVTWEVAPGTVEYGIDTNTTSLYLAHTSGNYYEASIDTTTLTDGDHSITVKAIGGMGNITTATLDVQVDNSGPVITLEDPGSEMITGEYIVRATVNDANLDMSSVMLVMDGNVSDARPMERDGYNYTYTIDTAAEWECGTHNVSVLASDTFGHETLTDNVTLTVDNCAPMVMFVSPGGHVMGFYDLEIQINDTSIDTTAVWAVFDNDTLNRLSMDYEGEGNFVYMIDTTTMEDGDHDVYIIATDLNGLTMESDPLDLKVDNNAPVSTITSEGGNVSGYYTLSAIVEDAYLNTSWVYMVVDGDDANATMMYWAGDHYEVTVDTRNTMDGNRSIRIWAADLWGQTSRSADIVLYVDNNAPYVRLLSNGGTKWGTYKVRANVTDPNLDTACVKCSVGGAEPVAMQFSTDEWYYNLDTRMLPEGPVDITIMACDTRGNRNDQVYVSIVVSNRADVEVTKVEWTSMKVEKGSMAKVKVTVRNNGHTTANNFEVALLSGSKVLASAKELTGILPGKSHTFTLEWKPASTGSHVVRVEADSTDQLEEADETNNDWEQQTITVSEGTPGMGAALAVMATLGAGALVRRRR